MMNCQHEPPYPGDSTVVFSIRFPNITVHPPTNLCAIEEPHDIAECDEWNCEEIFQSHSGFIPCDLYAQLVAVLT